MGPFEFGCSFEAVLFVLFRNMLVTPTPHIQGKNMNKHLDKIWPLNTSQQDKIGSLGAIFLFILLPCMWGLGFQKESPFFVFEKTRGLVKCTLYRAPPSPVAKTIFKDHRC